MSTHVHLDLHYSVTDFVSYLSFFIVIVSLVSTSVILLMSQEASETGSLQSDWFYQVYSVLQIQKQTFEHHNTINFGAKYSQIQHLFIYFGGGRGDFYLKLLVVSKQGLPFAMSDRQIKSLMKLSGLSIKSSKVMIDYLL